MRRPFLLAVVFSLLIHAFLVGLSVLLTVLIPPEDRVAEMAKQKSIEVTLVPKVPKGIQIADIAPPKEEKVPDKARFVGEYDSAVKKEIVAPSRRPGGGTSKKESPPTLEKKLEKALGKKSEKNKVSMRGIGGREDSPPDSVASRDTALADARSGSQSRTSGSAGGGENDYFNGASEDFFPDYKVGDHTYLNVLKYPKIGYFVRLKKAFRTTFNPVPALRSSLTRVSHGQIDVVLAVTVDRMGKLAGLQVIHSSGIPSYDQEAVRTVRDSAPFSAPPSDLLDGSSLLRMAWTFTVYL